MARIEKLTILHQQLRPTSDESSPCIPFRSPAFGCMTCQERLHKGYPLAGHFPSVLVPAGDAENLQKSWILDCS